MAEFPAVWWRSFCGTTLVLLVPCSMAGPGYQQLADEPVGLAWSAAEVEHASAGSVSALFERVEREVQPGCDSVCERRLRSVFERLLRVSREQTSRSSGLPWSLTIVQDPGVQAMALPGGQVLVSQLFVGSEVLSEEALAFVLAHEMAHCILEHERQTLSVALMLLPRDVPRSVADIYTELDYNFTLLKILEPVFEQSEFEADELGFLMASSAGFAPWRQLEFLEREAARGEERLPIVRTHPPAAQRLQRLRERLPLANGIHAAANEDSREP